MGLVISSCMPLLCGFSLRVFLCHYLCIAVLCHWITTRVHEEMNRAITRSKSIWIILILLFYMNLFQFGIGIWILIDLWCHNMLLQLVWYVSMTRLLTVKALNILHYQLITMHRRGHPLCARPITIGLFPKQPFTRLLSSAPMVLIKSLKLIPLSHLLKSLVSPFIFIRNINILNRKIATPVWVYIPSHFVTFISSI